MKSSETDEPRKYDPSESNLPDSDLPKKRVRSSSLFDEMKRQLSNNKRISINNETKPNSSTRDRDFGKITISNRSKIEEILPSPHKESKPPKEGTSLNHEIKKMIHSVDKSQREDMKSFCCYNVEEVSPGAIDHTSSRRKSKLEDERKHYERLNNSTTKTPRDSKSTTKYREKRRGLRHDTSSSNLITDYSIIEKIGMGTYGKVYKAKHNKTGKYVALKRVHLSLDHEGFPITAVREIKILRNLRNENIVNLIDVVSNKEELLNLKKDVFYLVFEYLEHDLMGLIKAPKVHFNSDEISSLMKQLLKGLLYCHSNNYLHRDIKGSNILISSRGKLKLADFGLARIYNSADKSRPYTNKVITLGYRPPELLLGEERYGPSIDVWSCGCILGELFKKRQIFKGHNELEQLEAIINVCGTITPAIWPSVVNLPLYHVLSSRTKTENVLKEEFSFIPSKAYNLLEKMLVLDPSRRISVSDALEMPWIVRANVDRIKFENLPRHRSHHEFDPVGYHSRHDSRRNS